MTSSEAALSELLDTGLHALAQPLTAALWIAELRTLGEAGATFSQKMEGEIVRALGILRTMQQLHRQHAQGAVCEVVDAALLLKQVVSSSRAEVGEDEILFSGVLHDSLFCFANAAALQQAFAFLLESAHIASEGQPVAISAEATDENGITIEIRVSTADGERLIKEFRRAANPLHAGGDASGSHELPEAALVSASLRGMGCALEIASESGSLIFRCKLVPAAAVKFSEVLMLSRSN